MDDEPSKQALKRRVERLEAENEELRKQKPTAKRRGVVQLGTLLGSAGLLSLLFGSASAQTGEFPAASSPALLRIRADRVRYVPRGSDPSSPDGGTKWVIN